MNVTSGALSIQERVRFTLKSCLEIPDMPNGTVHSGCKDPTKATARLIIDTEEWYWGQQSRKGTFRSERPK